ncbi:hypothetical protein SK128_001063 [Halocaridina rubra]|uniref:Dynein assembly factor 5 n=1 Tax=Halocaridina rubra TaxID=373956 RepID=A0AAN9A0K2_HALRR
MATENADPDASLNEILNLMQDQHKAKRKKALEKLEKLIFESVEKESENRQPFLRQTLQFCLASLTSCMTDASEANRLKACEILMKFIEGEALTEKHLVDVIPVLYHRLAKVPQLEESEDVRLLYIKIIHGLAEYFQEKMTPYMNDIVNILKESVLDASPEVRKASCECVSTFAKATKDKFHMQSESLVKPLIKGLAHQRFRNRIACITALGDILLYGDGKAIQTVCGPLAQCSMDLPQVRLCLVDVGGSLGMEMPDRYSYWQYILPLILFGICDEDTDVQEKAKKMWFDIGHQYESENEDQLKQEIDFDIVPSRLPAAEIRPGVGCRTIVQRSLYHILPGLLTDLDDWQDRPRLQAAKLLTTLVVNAETGITQYAEKIMAAIHLAAGDKEESVLKQVFLCCECLGHFLPPKTYLPLVLPRLTAGEKGERPLKVLTALLRGTPDDLTVDEIRIIIEAISNEEIAYVYHFDHQTSLLELITVILERTGTEEISYQLFTILLFISSSSEFQDAVNVAQNLMNSLAIKTELENVDHLYKQHLTRMLKYLHQSSESWLEHTPQFQMFIGLLEFAGSSLGTEVELIVDILCACIPKKQDPLVSLKCLLKMQKLLVRDNSPLLHAGQFGHFLPVFVHECVLTLLPWHAGMTASSLRTAALSCFVGACQVKDVEESLINEVKLCLDLVPALIEDESEDTRMLACEAVYWVKSSYPQIVDSDIFHKFSDKLVKRLDDVKASVRLRAAQVLSFLFGHLPENYNSGLQSKRLEDLFESAIIYLDDPDIRLQEAVLDTLETMGKVSPHLLTKLVERDCHKYRNKHHCVQLLNSLKTLTITS